MPLCGIIGLLGCAPVSAEGTANVVTLDLPVSASVATPVWLGHPSIPATVFASLALPIMTPDPGDALLVTVYFREKENGLLRISWEGTQGSQVLSANFNEGIGMANQRSLLLPASLLAGDGTLVLQGDSTDLGVQRIRLELLQSRTSLMSPDLVDSLVTGSSGKTVTEQSLDGQPAIPGQITWRQSLVVAPLADGPVRIEDGVEFSVSLDAAPTAARLVLQETGLPLDRHLVVWINEQRVGVITPAVPDLSDAGFLSSANDASDYVGWRDGSFYIPARLLKAGPNTIQFQPEEDVATTNAPVATSPVNAPVALKDINLQLSYPASAGATGAIAPATTSAPATPP